MATVETSATPLMTPQQVADYLQLSRETVYRYIREGRLPASRFGNAYRIRKRDVDVFVWANRANDVHPLREYSEEQIAEFLREDALSDEAREIAERFLDEWAGVGA